DVGVGGLVEERLQLLEFPLDPVFEVGAHVGLSPGEQDAHQWNPCRLSLEDGMRSSSRYFATVRRAMRRPSSLRICTMAASDSGRRGSSSPTTFLMRSLTARDDTSSPWVELIPEWKKYFISNKPRGVCMYLWFTTRLTVDSCMPMSSATSFRMRGLRCS